MEGEEEPYFTCKDYVVHARERDPDRNQYPKGIGNRENPHIVIYFGDTSVNIFNLETFTNISLYSDQN